MPQNDNSGRGAVTCTCSYGAGDLVLHIIGSVLWDHVGLEAFYSKYKVLASQRSRLEECNLHLGRGGGLEILWKVTTNHSTLTVEIAPLESERRRKPPNKNYL